eukprot:gene17519-6057_t
MARPVTRQLLLAAVNRSRVKTEEQCTADARIRGTLACGWLCPLPQPADTAALRAERARPFCGFIGCGAAAAGAERCAADGGPSFGSMELAAVIILCILLAACCFVLALCAAPRLRGKRPVPAPSPERQRDDQHDSRAAP